MSRAYAPRIEGPRILYNCSLHSKPDKEEQGANGCVLRTVAHENSFEGPVRLKIRIFGCSDCILTGAGDVSRFR